MNPARIDAIIDLGYGALILLSVVLIATLELQIGLTFGLGVFASYILHVVWKMARFDPDWMTKTVQETVEDAVEAQIGDQLAEVQEQVESVEKRVERRPSENELEAIIEETVEHGTDESVGR